MNTNFIYPVLQHVDQRPTASRWTTGWIERLPVGLKLLDVASGYGQTARIAVNLGFNVTAVDRDSLAMESLKDSSITAVCADLENTDFEYGLHPSLASQFDCVVVRHYLWRPRWFQLMRWLKPDGVFLYETFAAGHQHYGRPKRADFLLRSGELIERCGQYGLQIIAFEDGVELNPNPSRVQRVCAIGPLRKRDTLLLK